jgi:S-methylmethionine-dependent homocysteine/selenocysteine methylase
MTTALLPQLAGGLFLSDGGLETTLVYLEGLELPHFAAFVPALNVLGGCCGTDQRHLRAIRDAWILAA